MSAPAGATSDRLSPALRTEALEQLLVERELIDPAVMDKFIKTYEQDVGPLNGAKVVARAWTDPEYREWLLRDGTAAIKDMGFGGPQGEHMVVARADRRRPPRRRLHPVLLLPVAGPRAAAELVQGPGLPRGVVRTPRRVLREMGLEVPEGKDIQVWDSSAEVRYLVLPQRPAGTDGWDAEAPRRDRHARRDGRGRRGERPVTAVLDVAGAAAPPRSNGELVFAEPWESRAFGMAVTLADAGVVHLGRVPRRPGRPHRRLGGRPRAGRGLPLLPLLARRPRGPCWWRRARCPAPRWRERSALLAERPSGHDHADGEDHGHGHGH